MAQKVQILLEDDLDGSKAEQTVSFAVHGKFYEIDLSKKNLAAFDKAISPYVAAARGVKAPSKGAGAGRAAKRNDSAEIRAWAKEHNIEVPDRGRISAEVRDAYYAR